MASPAGLKRERTQTNAPTKRKKPDKPAFSFCSGGGSRSDLSKELLQIFTAPFAEFRRQHTKTNDQS
jgi:hypothetical protein